MSPPLTCFFGFMYNLKVEIDCVMEKKKPYYLIRMCRDYLSPTAKFFFSERAPNDTWLPGEVRPDGMIERIEEFYKQTGHEISLQSPCNVAFDSRGRRESIKIDKISQERCTCFGERFRDYYANGYRQRE